MSSKIYLITGANRGLGLGLVEALLQRPNVTILAGVRDLSSSSSKSLAALPSGVGSRIIVLQMDISITSTISSALATLLSYSINHIDIVIANAGISKYYGPAVSTPISEVRDHLEINTIGALTLL
jgi:norsolorinic acid ketoreductase